MNEREQFEAWVEANGGSVDRTDGGEYRAAPTECAWDAWQACAEGRSERIEEYERALKVLHTWAGVADGLVPEQVRALTSKALHMTKDTK